MNPDENPWVAPAEPLCEKSRREEGLMRQSAAWMFKNPDEPVTPVRVVLWWEARRLPFNLIVGAYGILCLVISCAAIVTSGHLQPGEDLVEPLALLLAPIGVNFLYTLGWFLEIVARGLSWEEPPTSFGPRLLKLGFGLALVLCTIPATF